MEMRSIPLCLQKTNTAELSSSITAGGAVTTYNQYVCIFMPIAGLSRSRISSRFQQPDNSDHMTPRDFSTLKTSIVGKNMNLRLGESLGYFRGRSCLYWQYSPSVGNVGVWMHLLYVVLACT